MVITNMASEAREANTDTDVAAGKSCLACAHSWQTHDAIGIRYCTATIAGGLTRGCVCG